MTAEISAPEHWKSLLSRIVEITVELEPGEVMRRVADLVLEGTGADACFLHLLDSERRRLVLAGATPPFDHLVGTIELALGEGVAGSVAASGQPAVIADKWNDPRYKYIPELRGEDFTSLVSLPLVRPGRRVVGVFNLHTRARRDYSDEELVVLESVAGLLAGVVDSALLYHRLAEREAQVERFAARTIELQEIERHRLASEIHDGISQQVVGLLYRLSAASDLLSGGQPEVAAELAAARTLAGAALDEARRAITGLRPAVLDDLGLSAGLETLGASLPRIEFEVGADSCSLPPHLETALFRIAQEAVQNVVKHAGAGRVWITLRQEGEGVRLVVGDDGCGFDPDGAVGGEGYGVISMRERGSLIGAQVSIESHPGRGTRVTVTVPRPDQLGMSR